MTTRTKPTDQPSAIAAVLRRLKLRPEQLDARPADVVFNAAVSANDVPGQWLAREMSNLDPKVLKQVKALLAQTEAIVAPTSTGATTVGSSGVLRMTTENKLRADQGDASAGAEAAARMLAIYRPKHGVASRPFERFLIHVAALHDFLVGREGEQMMFDKALAEKVRVPAFYLEELLKQYREHGPVKKIEGMVALVKELEDTLGAFGYRGDMRGGGSGLELPPGCLTVLGEEEETAKLGLRAVINGDEDGWDNTGKKKKTEAYAHGGWRPDKNGRIPALDQVVDTLVKVDFGDELEDAIFNAQMFAAKFDEMQDARLPFDVVDTDASWEQAFEVLEVSTHKARRDVRRFPIRWTALDGLVELDIEAKAKNADVERLKLAPIAQSKYANLPPAVGKNKHRIRVPYSLSLAFTKAIERLGIIKDEAQLILGVAETLAKSGKSTKRSAVAEAHRILGKDPTRLQDIIDESEQIWLGLQKDGVFKELGEVFKAAAKRFSTKRR
jgi:hypothetical protein